MSDNPPKKRIGFFRSSMIYAVGDLLTKGARIILVPYFIAALTKPEMGQLAILQAIIFATWTLLSFGFGQAIQRYFSEYGDRQESFVTTVWITRYVVAIPVFLLLLLVGRSFASEADGNLPADLITLAITAGFFRAGLNVTELWLVIREEPVVYRLFTFCQFLLTTLLTIFFITWLGGGVAGAMWAEITSYILFTMVGAVMHFRNAPFVRGLVQWPAIVSYALPVLPHALFMWGASAFDRILLERFVPTAEIAEYHVGYLLASIVTIGAMAMRSAWMPGYFRETDRVAAGEKFGRRATLFILLIVTASLVTFVFADEMVAVFLFFGKASYARAPGFVRIVVVGMVGFCIFIGFNQPLFYERRIRTLATISGLGFAANVACNLWFIPLMGTAGAAVATLISYWVFAALLMGVLSRVHDVQWETGKIFWIAAAAIAVGAASMMLPAGLDWRPISIKLIVVLGYVAVVVGGFRVTGTRI